MLAMRMEDPLAAAASSASVGLCHELDQTAGQANLMNRVPLALRTSPSSPVGSALLSIRRARAFEGEERVAELVAILQQAAAFATSQQITSNGLSQAALDALSVEAGDASPSWRSEHQQEGAEAISSGLSQTSLDALCEGAAAISCGLSQSSLDALCVDGNTRLSVTVPPSAVGLDQDEKLLRSRRMRAFMGVEAAAAFASQFLSTDAALASELSAGSSPNCKGAPLPCQKESDLEMHGARLCLGDEGDAFTRQTSSGSQVEVMSPVRRKSRPSITFSPEHGGA